MSSIGLLNRGKFADILDPSFRRIEMQMFSMPLEIQPLFQQRDSDRDREKTSFVAPMGVANKALENESLPTDEIQQGFDRTWVHDKFGVQVRIPTELIEDDLKGIITKVPQAVSRSLISALETQGALIFNNGFSAVTLGGDQKALFVTDHPLRGGGTQSNTFAAPTALAVTSVRQLIQDVESWSDHRGVGIRERVMGLLVHPQNILNSEEILRSTTRPDTTNRADNILKMGRNQGIRIVSSNFLTSTTNWFSWTTTNPLIYWTRRRPTFKTQDLPGDDGVLHTGTIRFVYGWEDFIGWFGVTGS